MHEMCGSIHLRHQVRQQNRYSAPVVSERSADSGPREKRKEEDTGGTVCSSLTRHKRFENTQEDNGPREIDTERCLNWRSALALGICWGRRVD